MNFQFTSKIKNVIFAIMGVGIVLMVLGFFTEKSHLYVSPQTNENIALLEKYKSDPKSFSHEEKLYWNQNKEELRKGVELETADALLVEYYHKTPWSEEELKADIVKAGKEEGIAVTFEKFKGEAKHASHKEHKSNVHAHAHTDGESTHDHGHEHNAGEEHNDEAHNHHNENVHSHGHTNADTTHDHNHEHKAGEEHNDDAHNHHNEDSHNHDSEEAHHGNAETAEAHGEEGHEAGHEVHELVFVARATAIGSGHDDHHGNAEEAEAHGEESHEGGHGSHGANHSPIYKLNHIIHEAGTFDDTHHTRSWSNLLVNGFFFFGIGLGALFFIALQYATESGWGVVTKRLLEAITGYLPIGSIFLIIVFLGGTFGLNHIYHWMDPHVSDPLNDHFDPIIANKSPYLSQSFFWIATIVYIAVFLMGARIFRKRSLKEDIEGGTKIHFKNYVFGAIFLVLFGYLSSSMAWHWIMSIDTHWFSTLFGWYVFSGIWISGIITTLLLIFFLKGQGYLSFVNDSHIHDLGKWMFAVSILWSYLLFSQFMLIWYANIPEEVTYYLDRFRDYKILYWSMFCINLILPLIFLMSREAKRSKQTIVLVGCILFVTHWIDVFIMVMPGTVFDHWEIGALEIGMFLTFLAIFSFIVLRSLTKAPLLVKNHPYLDENLHQHT